MRIISPFRDYYDSVMEYGQDQSLIYVRQPKEVQLERFPFMKMDDVEWVSYAASLWEKQYMIGFCGIVYPVLELRKPAGRSESIKEAREGFVYCYDLESVDAFVGEVYSKSFGDYKHPPKRRSKWNPHQSRTKFARFFEICEEQKNNYWRMFEDERCPVFVAEYKGPYSRCHPVTWNAQLRQFDFTKVKDPYTAFQEIVMWLANQAEPRKPIPVIDDVTMAEAKGFDKYSFRKDKSK